MLPVGGPSAGGDVSPDDRSVLWEPSAERIAASRLAAFQREVERTEGREFADFAALHAWSVEDRAAFWRHVWEFCAVMGGGEGPG